MQKVFVDIIVTMIYNIGMLSSDNIQFKLNKMKFVIANLLHILF